MGEKWKKRNSEINMSKRAMEKEGKMGLSREKYCERKDREGEKKTEST